MIKASIIMSIVGVHSPALPCPSAAPGDEGRPAGALSNSADKGTHTDGAGSAGVDSRPHSSVIGATYRAVTMELYELHRGSH